MKRVLVGLGLLSAGCNAVCLDSCRGGVALPHGSSTLQIGGGTALLYSLHGKIQGSDESISLAHVVISGPSSSAGGFSGSSLAIACAGVTETIAWREGSSERSVAFSYDGVSRRFAHSGRSWDTTTGNAFILEFDAAWQPTSVRQVPAVVTSTDPVEVVRLISAAAPELDAVRTRGGS